MATFLLTVIGYKKVRWVALVSAYHSYNKTPGGEDVLRYLLWRLDFQARLLYRMLPANKIRRIDT